VHGRIITAMASLTLDWLQLAALAGALQGLFLAGNLFTQRNNRTANRLLAILMLAFTVFLFSTVYYSTTLFERWPHFFGVSYHMPFIFGPLVYLYAKAASDRSWRFTLRDAVHFLPVAITIGTTIPMYALSGAEKVALLREFIAGNVPTRLMVFDAFKFISGIGYSIATVRLVLRHQRQVRYSYSNTERVNLRWLLWFAGAAAAIWVMAVSIDSGSPDSTIRDDHVSLAMAIMIYAIGYTGLRQPEIFRYETREYAIPPTMENPADARYERSGLDDREAENLRVQLVALMETEQPWKDSELTLAQLAERLATTPHKLSEVLNAQVGQTFYDFVNGYRVREVQRRIKAGDASRLKMLALALDAGFASKSTFNDVFKKHTNQTPSAYALQGIGNRE
jgi:AraC-like DNA-binding protein